MKNEHGFTEEELAGMTGEELVRLAEKELTELTDKELEGASGGFEIHSFDYWVMECTRKMARCKTVEELNAAREAVKESIRNAQGLFFFPKEALLEMCDRLYDVFLKRLETNNTAI